MANKQNNQEVVYKIALDATDFNNSINEAGNKLKDMGETPISSNSVKTIRQQLKEANNEAQKIGQTLEPIINLKINQGNFHYFRP